MELTLFSAILIGAATIVSGQYMSQYGANGQCPPFMCPLHCPNGYVVGPSGCRSCACVTTSASNQPDHFNPGGDPMHQGGAMVGGGGKWSGFPVSPSFAVPCVPGATCGLSCPNGFLATSRGCQVCMCAPKHETTTVGHPYVYTNPCPSAPSACDQSCSGVGYATGRDGCQHCACATTSQVSNTTTTPSVPTTTTPEVISSAVCMFRMTKCQIKCRTGFLTDSARCKMCVCKDEIYAMAHIPLERQPKVKLANPCVKQYDLCRIVCSSGYRTGVRGCQYCACRE